MGRAADGVRRLGDGPAAVLDASAAWDAGSERMARWAPDLAPEAGRVSARIDAREGLYAFGAIAGAIAGTKVDGNLEVDTKGKVPRIGGRSVPVAVAAVPGFIAAGILCIAAVPMLLTTVGPADAPADALLVNLVLPFWFWGPMLALAVWGYVLHRRVQQAPPGF